MPRPTLQDVVDRLESLHMIALEIDAFQSAFDGLFNQVDWPRPARSTAHRRRDLQRLGCYLARVNESIETLLAESRAVVRDAMQLTREA